MTPKNPLKQATEVRLNREREYDRAKHDWRNDYLVAGSFAVLFCALLFGMAYLGYQEHLIPPDPNNHGGVPGFFGTMSFLCGFVAVCLLGVFFAFVLPGRDWIQKADVNDARRRLEVARAEEDELRAEEVRRQAEDELRRFMAPETAQERLNRPGSI